MTQDTPRQIGNVSFWYGAFGGTPAQRPALSGPARADICIIGAGFTGLWAAYYLKRAEPSLDILVLEKEFAGFGASGRNGGWLSAGFAWSHERYMRTAGADAVRALVGAIAATPGEVIAVAQREGIAADIAPVDEMAVATSPAQLSRLRAEIDTRRHWGETEAALFEIGPADALARVAIPGTLGAMIRRGSARIQPAKLVRGLAQVVERMGVRIREGTRVTGIAPGLVTTERGPVRAETILRATEGYSATLPGSRRDWIPLNSAQIVTAPLPPEIWERIGWRNAEILGDFAHFYCYCQRTADGRIALGSRGTPYRYGSGIDRNGAPDRATIRRLTEIFARRFPAAREAAIDHAWCGVLGVPRDWCATVAFDPSTGLGYAGGYVGNGVAASNLAGRSLCDLALRRDSGLTALAWANRPPQRWEPEPLRWLGIRGAYAMLSLADRLEHNGRAPNALSNAAHRLMGH